MPRQSTFWLTLIVAIAAGSVLVLGLTTGTFPSFLKTQSFGQAGSQHPQIVTGRLLFRPTPPQAQALHNALQNLTDPPGPTFNPNIPETSSTPEPSSTTRKNQQRIAAARQVLPALNNIPLADINSNYPSLISKTKVNEPAFRWFTIDLQEKPRIIEVTYTSDSPTSFQARSSRHASAVDRIKQAGQLLSNTGVELWEPKDVGILFSAPNDPYYHSENSWGQELDDLWGLKQINIEQAWDVTTGSHDVVVAVSDTGINLAHPDIAADLNNPATSNIWQNPGETGRDSRGFDKRFNSKDDDLNGFVDDWVGWDFGGWFPDDVEPSGNVMDFNGHGTGSSGIVGAIGHNGQDITGVNQRVKIMPVGIGHHAPIDGESTILYATLNGARVINMSWGGSNSRIRQSLKDALEFAADHDVFMVAAIGNSNSSSLSHPAAYPAVMAVGSSTPADTKSDSSNFGDHLDVVAPGTQMLTLAPKFQTRFDPALLVTPRLLASADGGTSSASPHVAGLAGLLYSIHPDWTAEQVRNRIIETADDIGELGFDNQTGHGRINAGRALCGRLCRRLQPTLKESDKQKLR